MYGYQCEIPDVWLPVRNTLCMVTSAKYLMYGYPDVWLPEIPYVWLPVRNTLCMVTSAKYLYVWLSVRNTCMYGYQ